MWWEAQVSSVFSFESGRQSTGLEIRLGFQSSFPLCLKLSWVGELIRDLASLLILFPCILEGGPSPEAAESGLS